MATAPKTYEVRWREAGTQTAWNTKSFPATSSVISIAGLQRGVSYEGEARAVAANGAASAWVDVSFVVDTKTVPVQIGAALDGLSTFNFSADYLGAISAGQLPLTLDYTRLLSGLDVSADATWSIVDVSGVVSGTITISTEGTVTVPSGFAMGATAYFTVRSVYDGLTIDKVVTLTKGTAAPPSTGSGGGTSVFDTSFSGVSGTSMAAISDILTVKTGTSGVITFSAPLSVIVSADAPEGDFEVALIWRWRAVGGSFADVSTEVASAPDASVAQDPEYLAYFATYGAVACSPTKTGLSASTDYEVQLFARRTSASPSRTVYFSGTASATGS